MQVESQLSDRRIWNEQAALPTLSVRLFGPFDVWVEGKPLPRLRSRKGQWLLALLALRGGLAVERTWLAGTLWPETTEENALVSLRQTLTDLRRALGPEAVRIVSPTTRTLAFDISGAFVDVALFDAATQQNNSEQNNSELLERAVALQQRPLLEDCLEEWALPERESRSQACLAALQTLASAAIAQGAFAVAVTHLRRVIAADPFHEVAHRDLMTALTRSGDSGAMLLAYRDLRLLLQREFRAEPAVETRALYQSLRTEALASSQKQVPETAQVRRKTAPAGLLPQPLTELVGREQEVSAVSALLFGSRLVTLTGPGGVGKTRLAIRVAEAWAEDQPDGVWFVDLAPLTDAALVPRTVAAVLGVREEPGIALTDTLAEALRDRRLLLILDNCEHLLNACAALAACLLDASPNLRLLATSRQALGLTGETVWAVPSLSVPTAKESLTPDVVGRADAVLLFVERAASVLTGFALTTQNAPTLAHLCRRLDGIPLAIELAAARVKMLSPEQIAARLDDRFHLLTQGSRTALPRQQTLQSAVDWSYDLLSEPERLLLSRLSVFAGGWTLEAAETICAENGLEKADILDVLTGLVNQSLVVLETDMEPTRRYRLLETMRDYGAHRLEERGETERAKRRHQTWCCQLAEHAEKGSRGPEQVPWLNQLASEHDNLRAALRDYHLQGKAREREGSDPGLHLANALRLFWEIRGHCREGLQWLQSLLDAEIGTLSERAYAFKNIGLLAMAEADTAAVSRAYSQSLTLFRRDNNIRGIGDILNNMGIVAWWQSDYAGAQEFYKESLAIDRELGDTYSQAGVLGNLGLVAQCQTDYVQARLFLEESLALRRAVGDQRGIANTLLNLGLVNAEDDNLTTASDCYEQSLALYLTLGQKDGIAISLAHLGGLAFQSGAFDRSRALHQDALHLFQEIGDNRRIADALGSLAEVSLAEGDCGRARELYREQFLLRTKLGEKRMLVASFESLSRLAAAQRQEKRAVRLCSAGSALRIVISTPLPHAEQLRQQCALESLGAILGETVFAGEWAAGQTMTLEETTAYVLRE